MSRSNKRPVTRRVIDPRALTGAAREALIDELHAIYASLYDHGDREFFETHVLFPPHDVMRLGLLANDEGEIVGFCNVYLCEAQLEGRTQAVLRGSVFARLGYDAAAHISAIGLRVVLWHLVRRPWRPLWFFALAANPASYRMFPRVLPEVYPSPQTEESPAVELFEPLAEQFGLPVDPAKPWICRFDPGVVDARRLSRSSRLRDCPHAQYYEAQLRPRGDGHVLLVLVPVNPPNLLAAVRHALSPRPSTAPKAPEATLAT